MRLSPELRRLARQLGADAEQSDDAVQDLWLSVLRSGESYDARRPLLPWLRGLLRFRWRSTFRRERLRKALLDEALAVGLRRAFESHDFGAAEAATLVRSALQTLPERYRAPLELHLLEGLSPAEVATRLAMPRSSVRVLLHRGRGLLRRSLPRGMSAVLLLLLRRPARASSLWPALLVAAAALLCIAILPTSLSAAREHDESGVSASANEALAASIAPQITAESSERSVVAAPDTLTVLVTRVDGSPLPHVGITVEPLDGTDPRLHRELACTDDDGRAILPRPSGVALRVSTDRRVHVELDEQQSECKLTVGGGLSVRGRVVDERGEALADAGVWLGDIDDSRRGQVVAHTALDGTFALEGVPENASLAAFAREHRRTAMTPLPRTASADGTTRIELIAARGGGEVRVLVRDAAGAPLRLARVIAGRSVDGAPPQLAQGLTPAFPPPLEERTDASGAARLVGLEPGRHPVVVRAVGFAPLCEHVDVEDGSRSEVVLRLSSSAIVCGRVVDSAGAPLAGAEVAWRNSEPLATVYLTTAKDGRFRAETLPFGFGTFAARCRDHGATELALDALRDLTNEIELVLAPLPICSGTLRDDADTPLADYELRLMGAPENALAPNSDEGRTDANGAFALAVPGGQIRRIEVRGPAWPQWSTMRREWLRQDGQTLQLVLPRAALPTSWLRGTLRSADATPARLRKLALMCRTSTGATTWLPDAGFTSSSGEMRIGPLQAGRYSLLLARGVDDEAGAPLGLVGDFELASGAELDVGCTLPVAGELVCELRFTEGAAPAAPIVSVTLESLAPASLTRAPLAHAGGGPELALWRNPREHLYLLPGNYAVHAMGEDFAWVDSDALEIASRQSARWSPPLERAYSTRIELAALPDDIDLAAGLTLRRADDGRAVGRFTLQLGAQPPQVLQCFLPLGDYTALVGTRDGRTQSAPVRITVPSVDARDADCLELHFDR